MELWFIIFLSLCTIIAYLIKLRNNNSNLPPGPPAVPLIGNILWLREPFSKLRTITRRLKPLYGPLITMTIAYCPLIVINSNSTHRALIQKGALFADRPPLSTTSTILNRTLKPITTSIYGTTWRLLRRNLTNNILNPGRVKSHFGSRKWVLPILLGRLRNTAHSVKLIDHIKYSMFCLLVFMCFGDKLEEREITQIEKIHHRIPLGAKIFSTVLNFWPIWVSKITFSKDWNELIRLRKQQDDVFIPLIRARLESKSKSKEEQVMVQITFLEYILALHDSSICLWLRLSPGIHFREHKGKGSSLLDMNLEAGAVP